VRCFIIALSISIVGVLIPINSEIQAASEFLVYSVYRGVSLGNPGEQDPPKDFYVNMGSLQGLQEGSILEVMRRVSTYNSLNEQLYQDVVFPIARIKVIHVESTAAITRLETMLPSDKIPSISPRAVMVGDLVRIVQ
jgi:hypothetical protein